MTADTEKRIARWVWILAGAAILARLLLHTDGFDWGAFAEGLVGEMR